VAVVNLLYTPRNSIADPDCILRARYGQSFASSILNYISRIVFILSTRAGHQAATMRFRPARFAS